MDIPNDTGKKNINLDSGNGTVCALLGVNIRLFLSVKEIIYDLKVLCL